MARGGPIRTSVGGSTADTITVAGHDLVDDLLGKISATELLYLEIQGTLPRPEQTELLNAMIVSLAEHGMMPSVIAARMTMLGAPESFQGALASGLLGVGDTFVGPSANVGRMLQEEAQEFEGSAAEKAERLVAKYYDQKKRIPGIGHPHHTIDPRAEKLLAMQRELGVADEYVTLMLNIHKAAIARRGSHLTFNATAAVGAIASDLGIEWRAIRGLGLVARSIGLVGHIYEEMRKPIGRAIWNLVEDHTEYENPV